jgi:hypothetical protein
MKRTFFAGKLNCLRTNWTLWQLGLGHVGDSLEVIMARVAEVSRAEAEEDSDGATVPALVLQIVCTMFRTHLCPGNVGTTTAHEFLLKDQ